MTNTSQVLLKVLTNSLVATLVCLLVAWLSAGDSWGESLFGLLGLLGAVATAILFKVFLIVWILSFFTKEK